MGGKISLIINALAALAFFGTGHPILFWICIVSLVVSFWSYGIMHNYASTRAKERWDILRENMIREGRPAEDIERIDNTPIKMTHSDALSVPDWLSSVNMASTFAGMILLIWGIIVRIGGA